MGFNFFPCGIDGVFEIFPDLFGDNRGYFLETYNRNEFEKVGISAKFVQDNESKSVKNVVRGLHFQKKYGQDKLVRVISGKVYDVIVDLRLGSATYGKHFGAILDSERRNMVFFPAGFAHGFCVISAEAVIAYKCTDFYHPEDEGGLMWNDPAIGIDWETVLPGITEHVILSEKDKKYAPFNTDKKYFDLNGKWIGE